MRQLQVEDLKSVVGGAGLGLDPSLPQRQEQRVLRQCGPQLDAYSAARAAAKANPTDARADLHSVAAGRSLALCSENAGFDPPAAWRSVTGGGK